MSQLAQIELFSVIKIIGDDAVSFLQGQVTCDVTQLKNVDWLAGVHCNAKGKMWSSFLAFQRQDAIYLVLSRESAVSTLAELNKYGVFAKADITDDSANWFIYGSNEQHAEAFSLELATSHFLVLSETQLEVTEASDEWLFNEVSSGRAHLFNGTIGEYVPQMLNLQALDYISFNKGCYMGQEMVARMRYLGKNKRALYIAEIEQDVSLEIAQDVYRDLNGNRRSAGKVINFASYNGKTVAQLVLPKDTDLTDLIYTDQESDTALQLVALPYSLEEE